MIENKYPIFGHGQVISKQALDLLRDNPSELTELFDSNKRNFEMRWKNFLDE